MISPNPLSLFCAILLCFPLALVLTISSYSSSIGVTPTVTHSLVTPSPPPPSPKHTSTPTKLLPRPKKLNSTTPPNNQTSSKQSLTRHLSLLPSPPPPSSPPPPVPEDDKDDIDLLKRATDVKPYTTEGHNRKVAFLFLTTTPLPFAPLWELFFNQSGARSSRGKYNIYIHADPTTRYNPPFRGIFSGRVIPSSKPTRRHTPTLVMAARRLIAHALLDDPDNHMFVILSAACVPLHSFNFTYTLLASSNKSFIEILSNETTAHGRWAARGIHSMLPEVSEDDFRIGSQFWSLTRRQARVVVRDTKLWRKFRLPCVDIGACYPEENYFPTLVSMVDPHGAVPGTLTNVDWRGRNDGHPRTYKSREVDPGLIRWLRERRPRYGFMGINGSDLSVRDRWDPFLFARKFEPNCSVPLLSIAKDVLFKD